MDDTYAHDMKGFLTLLVATFAALSVLAIGALSFFVSGATKETVDVGQQVKEEDDEHEMGIGSSIGSSSRSSAEYGNNTNFGVTITGAPATVKAAAPTSTTTTTTTVPTAAPTSTTTTTVPTAEVKVERHKRRVAPSWALPSEFRLSRGLFDPPLQSVGDPRQTSIPGMAILPRYQCAGEAYDSFMKQATAFVTNKTAPAPPGTKTNESLSLLTPHWGRRPAMAPPASPQNNTNTSTATTTKILFLGNSHTRQVAGALEWQYAEHIQSIRTLPMSSIGEGAHVETFQFDNDDDDDNNSKTGSSGGSTTTRTVSTTFMFNHPCIYSARWNQNIELIVQHPLDDFDAIVLGIFNPYSPSFDNTKQWTNVVNYTTTYPDQQINAKQPLLNIRAVAQAYTGPIVFVSPFSALHQPDFRTTVQWIRSQARTNLRAVNARRYITSIGGGECSSNAYKVAAPNPVISGSHRCMGNHGGLPDFVAWDVTEALYDVLLSMPSSKS